LQTTCHDLLNQPVIFENAAKIAGVPAHCERSENNVITSRISATCLRKFAARNVAFTFKNVFVVHALSQLSKNHPHFRNRGENCGTAKPVAKAVKVTQ